MKRQSQQGIALVITLILLSVITFMAVTFLVVSRHEGESVDTLTQRNVAKFAADGIQQQAIGQMVANMMGANNGYTNPGLLVSTNYVSPVFTNGISSLQNVQYFYGDRTPLSLADQLIMLTNLLYLPRAPVFVSTNKNQLNPEFRFFHDLNGNGVFETNGLVTNLDNTGNPIPNGSGGFITSVQVGDPEWIGFLEHPDLRHSPSNFFLSRGAFIAIPIGNAEDINAIHNQSRLSAPLMASSPPEAYYRNQGVTSGELSLAAFLQTLNTNVWGFQTNNSGNGLYTYATSPFATSKGTAFNDAAAIMQYRNSGSVSTLNSFQGLYGPTVASSFLGNGAVDAYAVGPLMTGVTPASPPVPVPWATSPWSGANNPVQLTRPRDLMTLIANQGGASANSFTNRLYSIGTALDTYDRYTFYRMLSQIGFSSSPEPTAYPVGGGYQPGISRIVSTVTPNMTNWVVSRNQMSSGTVPEPFPYVHSRKMNLNYNNLTSTNFGPWASPAQFFTNAADRLLRTYYPTNFALTSNGVVLLTNLNINFIPIYPVNFYTPGVHRLLQLAANMYDATTNKNTGVAPNNFDYPSVFRPIFHKTGTGANAFVYISGYYEVSNNIAAYQNAPLDLRRVIGGTAYEVDKLSPLDANNNDFVDNIFGIPYVIGARTNLPNFNQFSMAPVVQITRKLVLGRTNGTLYTNIAYVIGISNVAGLQCWNSYTNSISRPGGIRILAANDFSMVITNTYVGAPVITNAIFGLQQQFINPIATPASSWLNGINANGSMNAASFMQPMMSNAVGLQPYYSLLQNGNYLTNGNTAFFPLQPVPLTHSYLPDWGINITNRLRVIITDVASGRILDYVQLGGLGQLAGLDSTDGLLTNLMAMNFPSAQNNLWDTNVISTGGKAPANGLSAGLYWQYAISAGSVTVDPSFWATSPSGSSPSSIALAINRFTAFLGNTNDPGPQQMPFTVTMPIKKVYTWSANDPLVHYTTGDLTDLNKMGANNVPALIQNTNQFNNILTNLNTLSSRYQPWNKPVASPTQLAGITTTNQLQYRDPMVRRASDWQFPSNKYPNVGWLGRVHRGTPWQTVYLKSTPVDAGTWQYWTGNADPVDAANTQPISDWALLDLFTTAPNDNASRGQLSVNQTNAAAWKAALDGVMVISNSPTGMVPLNIDLTQSNRFYGNLVEYLVTSINAQRATLTNQGFVFTSIGQALATPALTVASPYITNGNASYLDTNLTDAAYERIPQQIGSLLRVGTPRYEIYAYGQALKPADKSIVQSGPSFGLCTNYQITGEVLTRTVVRFDNMPVPGQPLPGMIITNALPILGSSPISYALVTNVVPPVRAVVESFSILGPDQ